MPRPGTTNWRPFPPQTREVQFDEKWAFVGKKQQNCRPDDPADDHHGDHWDHVAFDPEHKLVVSLITGKRTKKHTAAVVADFHRRTGGRMMRLITSDEYKPYKDALRRTYGEKRPRRRRFRRGRKPLPRWTAPKDLLYVTVHKHRRKGRVVRVSTHVIFGTAAQLQTALAQSPCSTKPNIAFVERYNATDRHRVSRKVRKSYRFSKDWNLHVWATWLATGTYNFCWPVRTLRMARPDGTDQDRTPAMSAGLTDHVWQLSEWLAHPVKFHLVT